MRYGLLRYALISRRTSGPKGARGTCLKLTWHKSQSQRVAGRTRAGELSLCFGTGDDFDGVNKTVTDALIIILF